MAYGDERLRTDKAYKLDVYDPDRVTGRYDMPMLKPVDFVPTSLTGFNYARSAKSVDCGVHFFLDDYQFERMWTATADNIEVLRKFECVLTPQFSLYTDMPLATQIWNVYRSRQIGQQMQDAGLTVIPSLCWSDVRSHGFAFDGIPTDSTVAVSTVGNYRNPGARQLWRDGMTEALRRLRPRKVLVYGHMIDFDFGKCAVYNFAPRKWGAETSVKEVMADGRRIEENG